jgi:2-dehydropantoate 2-reductase
MRVTIVGAGAMGGVTGAFLARAGVDLTLVDNVEQHVKAVQQDGLRMDGLEEFTVRVPAITPSELRGPLELVIIAVKTQHTGDALDEVAPHLGPDSVVMPLQNGLSALWIAERVGGERTVPTSITTHQFYMGPGHVRYLNRGVVHVGENEGRVTPRVEEIVKLLSHAYETHATDNVWGWIWAKMIAASVFFTTALVDAPMGPILTASDRHRRMFVRIAGETTALAHAHGVRVQPSVDLNADLMLPRTDAEWHAALAEIDRMADGAGDVYTGVWRDIAVRKRRTEADSIVGPLLQEGEKAGLAMPLNRTMKRLINEIEDGQRTQSWENLEELLQVAEREAPLPAGT